MSPATQAADAVIGFRAPAPSGPSSAADMQDRAKACVTRLAAWVVGLGDAMSDGGRKVTILDIGDRRRIVEAHAWAGRWLAAEGRGTVKPPHRPGGDLVLHIPMGTLGQDDEDGEAISMGFDVVGPDSGEAYYIEKLAWKYRPLLPLDIRPVRAPSRKG